MIVNALIAKINRLQAEVYAIESKVETANMKILMEEVLNLMDGVGEGYVEEDYYARVRYRSSIPGVKNLRFVGTDLQVKITSPQGFLLPKTITIENNVFNIVVVKSKNFQSAVDY